MTRGHQATRIGRPHAVAFPHQDRTAHNRLAALASVIAMASAMALLSSMAGEAGAPAGPAPAPARIINFSEKESAHG
jgi:hypothetical protein